MPALLDSWPHKLATFYSLIPPCRTATQSQRLSLSMYLETCTRCGRTTWSGWGTSTTIDQLMRDVPLHDRCACHDKRRRKAAQTAWDDGRKKKKLPKFLRKGKRKISKLFKRKPSDVDEDDDASLSYVHASKPKTSGAIFVDNDASSTVRTTFPEAFTTR